MHRRRRCKIFPRVIVPPLSILGLIIAASTSGRTVVGLQRPALLPAFVTVSHHIRMSADAATGGGGSADLYGIAGGSWTSPTWNWGFARGTGHDCARICRARLDTPDERRRFVDALLDPQTPADDGGRRSPPFEEVKLVLALAWQRGRWDGSDGGEGGYGDVLAAMAEAERYEGPDEVACSKVLVRDMASRFGLIAKGGSDREKMSALLDSLDSMDEDDLDGVDVIRRKCSGLVLENMGFVRSGL